jgi:putative spermidine/putrescine transport system substrate-binding protein
MIGQSVEPGLASRRAVLKTTASLAIAATLAAPSLANAQDKRLVITAFAGVHGDNVKKHVLDPFTAKTGTRFDIKYGGANEWLTSAIVNRAKPEIDICFLSIPLAMRAIKLDGVFEELTPALVPNALELAPIFYDGYDRKAVGFNYAVFGIGYRQDLVTPKPASWKDLWDPRFAGKLILPDLPAGYAENMLVIAAMLNGGSESNLEPGFAAMKRLKPNVLRFFKNNSEPLSLFTQGDAVIGGWGSAWVYGARDSGAKVDFLAPREGAPAGVLSLHVAKNSAQRELALEFVNFAISREPQTNFATGIEYGACNRLVTLTGRAAERVPPISALMPMKWKLIEPQLGVLTERFQREIAS